MERFQANLLRDGKTVLDGVAGNFTDGGGAAGFFGAPAGTTLTTGGRFQLQLSDGRLVGVKLDKVIPNGHRPAIVHFSPAE
jgi:hypothetical protein